jgi:hypothetical protein
MERFHCNGADYEEWLIVFKYSSSRIGLHDLYSPLPYDIF